MTKTLKTVIKLLSDLLVVVVIVLAFLLRGLSFFGLDPYVVLSGSMESEYPTGSLLYVKDVDPAELAVGDTVTFSLDNGVIATHRIVEIVDDADNPGQQCFRTKGDENELADEAPVSFDAVVGQPVLCIPKLGLLAAYISEPSGRIVAVTVAVAVIILELFISLLFDDKKKKAPESAKTQEESDAHEE